MSEKTTVLHTSNQLIANTDVSKIFVGENRYQEGNYLNNSGYDPITVVEGTIMGRIHSTKRLTPLQTSAADGSQFPVGILKGDVEVESGDERECAICDMGDVVAEKIIFVKPGDGLDTVVSSRAIRDHLAAQGIKLVGRTEITELDNQ